MPIIKCAVSGLEFEHTPTPGRGSIYTPKTHPDLTSVISEVRQVIEAGLPWETLADLKALALEQRAHSILLGRQSAEAHMETLRSREAERLAEKERYRQAATQIAWAWSGGSSAIVDLMAKFSAMLDVKLDKIKWAKDILRVMDDQEGARMFDGPWVDKGIVDLPRFDFAERVWIVAVEGGSKRNGYVTHYIITGGADGNLHLTDIQAVKEHGAGRWELLIRDKVKALLPSFTPASISIPMLDPDALLRNAVRVLLTAHPELKRLSGDEWVALVESVNS